MQNNCIILYRKCFAEVIKRLLIFDGDDFSLHPAVYGSYSCLYSQEHSGGNHVQLWNIQRVGFVQGKSTVSPLLDSWSNQKLKAEIDSESLSSIVSFKIWSECLL